MKTKLLLLLMLAFANYLLFAQKVYRDSAMGIYAVKTFSSSSYWPPGGGPPVSSSSYGTDTITFDVGTSGSDKMILSCYPNQEFTINSSGYFANPGYEHIGGPISGRLFDNDSCSFSKDGGSPGGSWRNSYFGNKIKSFTGLKPPSNLADNSFPILTKWIDNYLIIKLPTRSSGTVYLFDITGNCIEFLNFAKNIELLELQLNSLQGVYCLKIETSAKIYSKKVIIN